MPFTNVLNSTSIPADLRQALNREFQSLHDDIVELRTRFANVQAALNAGTAVGAAGYPNASMSLGAKKTSPT